MNSQPQNERINFDPPPANERLSYNLDLAYHAIDYARIFVKIKNSSTQPLVKDRHRLFALDSKIKKNRKFKLTFNEAFHYFLLTNENFDVTDVKIQTSKLSNFQVGNCGELCDLVINFLRKYRVNLIKAYIFKGDHSIVLMDIAPNGDVTKPFTLGEHCVLIDPLNNYACSIKEIYKWLQCYRFDQNKFALDLDPHVLTSFTEQNKLMVSRSITWFLNYNYNKKMIDIFCDKLDIINKSFSKFAENENDLKVFEKMIFDFQDEVDNYDLSEFSNLELARELDKKIKKITNELQYYACEMIDNDEKIFHDILINISSLFPSPYIYFQLLIHFKPLLSDVIKYIENNREDDIVALVKKQLDNSFDQLLNTCITQKDIDTLNVLVDYGMDLNGETFLTLAIKENRVDIIKQLGDQIKLLTVPNKDGQMPLQLAIVSKKNNLVGLVLNQKFKLNDFLSLINYQDGDGWTALHAACESGNEGLVKELLKWGSKVTNLTNYGCTPLHIAITEGHLAIVRIILNFDPSIINIQNSDGATALFMAVDAGNADMVHELLKRGANPEIANTDGDTPLNIIKNSQHPEMTKFIIKKYLTIEIRNRQMDHEDELGSKLKKFRSM